MDDDLAELVEGIFGAEAKIREAMVEQARFLARFDRVDGARVKGSRSVQAWLSAALNLSPREAKTRVMVARGIEPGVDSSGVPEQPEYPLTAEAVESGEITFEQARTIIEGLNDLPPVAPDERADVEHTLVAEAHCRTPHQVRVLANRLRYAVDQDGVLHEEEYQVKTRELHLGTGRDGTTLLRGRLDRETGAKLRAVLEPLAAPRPAANGEPDPRTAARRNADALADAVDLLLATDELPVTGGTRPRIVATIDYGELANAVESRRAADRPGGSGGTLDPSGEPISAAALRRMACDAEILPAVLGGDSVPLDLGRTHRTAPPHLRSALLARDGRCAFPGCDHPPGIGEAHHVISWLDGGATRLDNLVMLCGFHHRTVHSQGWGIEFNHDRPTFVPPSWIDPGQGQRPGNRPHHRIKRRSSRNGPTGSRCPKTRGTRQADADGG